MTSEKPSLRKNESFQQSRSNNSFITRRIEIRTIRVIRTSPNNPRDRGIGQSERNVNNTRWFSAVTLSLCGIAHRVAQRMLQRTIQTTSLDEENELSAQQLPFDNVSFICLITKLEGNQANWIAPVARRDESQSKMSSFEDGQKRQKTLNYTVIGDMR